MDGKLYVKYEVIGKNNVAVPTHFFKVLLIENNSGQYELLSFVLPNQTLPGNVTELSDSLRLNRVGCWLVEIWQNAKKQYKDDKWQNWFKV